jgi:hypothetical protein
LNNFETCKVLWSIPVLATIPDALFGANKYVGDAPIGALLVGIGKAIEGNEELVVGANGRILVIREDDASEATSPLGRAIHESEARRVQSL